MPDLRVIFNRCQNKSQCTWKSIYRLSCKASVCAYYGLIMTNKWTAEAGGMHSQAAPEYIGNGQKWAGSMAFLNFKALHRNSIENYFNLAK